MDSIWIHGWATDSKIFQGIGHYIEPEFKEKTTFIELGKKDLLPAVLNEINTSVKPSEKTLIAGWSLGAMLALKTASGKNDMQISGLVLISACACFSRKNDNTYGKDKRIIKLMVQKLENNPEKVIRDFHREMFADNSDGYIKFQERYYPEYLWQNADYLIQGLRYLEQTDLRPLLKSIQCPVLIIHARNDNVINIHLARELAEGLHNSRLIELDSGGHIPFLGEEKHFARLISDFAYDI